MRLVPILAVLALAMGPRPAGALAPELLSYQGVLVRDNGVAVPNGVYNLRFRLFDHPTTGSQVFEQTLSTQVTNGLYNVILSNNGGYDLGDVMLQNSELFMEVTVLATPPAVPADITLLPRQQIASVPYAMAADVLLTPSPPVFTSPATRVHTNPTNTETTADAWASVTALEGITLGVSSSGCMLEIQAEIVVSANSNGRAVGVRLDQSANGAAYAAVRGPVAVTAGNAQPSTAVLTYRISNPAVGSYAYRVVTREDSDQDYIVSPKLGTGGSVLDSQSALSAAVWCPES
jgi:hypothetical protein